MKQSQRVSVIVDPVEFTPATLNKAINILIYGQTLKKLSRKGKPIQTNRKVTRSMNDSTTSMKRIHISYSIYLRRRTSTRQGSI